jgi:uncharacterized protein (TIGR02996 family)
VTDDQRALLAAIVADPGDDTARLAYADCIEEHGNSARAEFIRLQVQAERLHPNSNARAALEARAEAMFAEHWLGWWGEVCAEVGLPMPASQQSRRASSFAGSSDDIYNRLFAGSSDKPYKRQGVSIFPSAGSHIDGWHSTTFHRGFPDKVEVSIPLWPTTSVKATLDLWSSVAPLASLTVCEGTLHALRGLPLAGVISLEVSDRDLQALVSAIDRPRRFWPRLEELSFHAPLDSGTSDRFADDLAQLVENPHIRHIKRLALDIYSHREAEVLANASNLAGLESLDVNVSRYDRDATPSQLAILPNSPHLSELRELTVRVGIGLEGYNAIFRKPTWKRLRKLALYGTLSTECFQVLANGDDLPQLEEFMAISMELDPSRADLLERAPLWKRLRHFSLAWQFTGGLPLSVLVNVMNLERLETFAVEVPRGYENTSDCRQVRERLGDRLRLKLSR